MKVNTVPLKSVINDWLVTSGRRQQDIDEDLVLRQAIFALSRTVTDIQLEEKIALLYPHNYKAELPPGFKYVVQAAYCTDTTFLKERRLKERIVEWTQSTLDGTGCDLKINLDCPKCTEIDCNCNAPFVTVDVNRIYESANPDLYVKHSKHFYKAGGTTKRGSSSPFHPKFSLMKRTSTSFFNIPYHINECLNLKVDSAIEYNIAPPYMITNMKEGVILLSYLSAALDEDNNPLVPDVEALHRAIFFTIEEAFALQEYIQTDEQSKRLKWQALMMEADKWRGKARSQMQIPDPDEFKQFLDNHWRKIIPYYDWEANLNRNQVDRFFYPDQTSNIRGYRGGSAGTGSSWKV